ncbi:NADPH:quinone reductase [Actinoplanes sp. NPDC049265]|uniref:NADPH:quinone reductase n=1 Tax=Actinoplanes sp. NPDC049265 TaxID=3363902 RepID=UPI0037204B6C
MKAIIYSEVGDAGVLQLVERDVPEPGAGEVRVKVAVSGVNPTDWKTRSGATNPKKFDEVTPHLDGAGVIDAVGAGVDPGRVGQRVWLFMATLGRNTGTASEYTVVDEWHAVPLGDASFELGASLGVPALTAHRVLTVSEDGPDRLAPKALDGKAVLVAGGAGAVGHAAIQLARWSGATVISTISGPEKAALATAAGAHHVVNYRDGDAAEQVRGIAPDGVDIVAEVALGANLALDLAVLRTRGTICTYANDGGKPVELDVRQNMMLNTRFQFMVLYTVGAAALRAGAEDIAAAVRDGALPVGEEHGLPLTRFPLDRTADAHRAVQDGAVGKVLVNVG